MPQPNPQTSLFPVERWALAAVIALTAARLVVAIVTPISPDESYYWLWTRPLQLAYFDHPGMVAWWIWCSTHLLGNTSFGMRLPAVLSSIAVTALAWDTGRIIWNSREAAARAALWLNATLIFGAVGVLMTPDAPMVLFWTMGLWAIARLVGEGRARWLYVAGLAIGLGTISKYTTGLLAPGVLVSFIVFADLRRWFASVHLWIALALSIACTAPVIIWNSRNDWASVAKQFDHAFESGVDQPLLSLLSFVGSQLGMATPIIFVFIIWATGWILVTSWREGRADRFLLGASSLPVIVFFAIHALSNIVQAHWPGPAYLGGAIAAAGVPMVASARSRTRRAWIAAAPTLGIAMTAAVYLQATTAVLPLPMRVDATKRLSGSAELVAAIEQTRQAHLDAFLATTKHETAGILSFYLPDHPVVFQIGGPIRPPTYDATMVAALKGRDAILISSARDTDIDYLGSHFAHLTPLGGVAVHWGGRVAEEYRLNLAEGYRGGLIIEGDGYPGAIDKP